MCPVQPSDSGFSVCFKTQKISKLKIYQQMKKNRKMAKKPNKYSKTMENCELKR